MQAASLVRRSVLRCSSNKTYLFQLTLGVANGG
jgi:hypothetical protein